MTEAEAIALADSKFWEGMTMRERAVFQMFERRLCMPFPVFHEALEAALGRPVWTHELGLNAEGLKKELLGTGPAPTFEDIINLIPVEKRIVVTIGDNV